LWLPGGPAEWRPRWLEWPAHRYCGSLTTTARTPCANAMPATIAATSASTWRLSASSAVGGSDAWPLGGTPRD
jgi:hypothetical protein